MAELPGFGEELRSQLAANIAAHERHEIELDGRRHAAVAVVVVDSDPDVHGDDPYPFTAARMAAVPGAKHLQLSGSVAGTAGGPAVLLTRRAARLRAHSGQWALPGGRVDDGERPVDTALRELHEELDLELAEPAVLGALDDYATRSGFVITPFVLWGGADPAIRPHPDEVLSVHRVAFRDPESAGELVTRFEIAGEATLVTQELDYRLRRRGPFAWLTDRLFIRSQGRGSVARSLARLKLEVEELARAE